MFICPIYIFLKPKDTCWWERLKFNIYNKFETIHSIYINRSNTGHWVPFHLFSKATELHFDSNLTTSYISTKSSWIKQSIFPTDLKQTSHFLSQKVEMSFLCLPSNWSLPYPGYPPTYVKSFLLLSLLLTPSSEYTRDHNFVFIKSLVIFWF